MASIYDFGATETLTRRARLDGYHLRRLRGALFRRHLTIEQALEGLPAEARAVFAREIDFHTLELSSRHDSQLDGATKLVFRNAQGLLLESVILRMTTGRTALCVSTQIGCRARCDFCATGRMGIARNLSAGEILDQWTLAGRLLAAEKRVPRNLVMMGMGEPFHNEEQVYAAFEMLADARGFNLNLKRVMISTAGVPEAMVRCARRYPLVRQALSLHSARQDVRRRIMPLADRHSLDELRDALLEVVAVSGQRVMIEYLLLAGVNDGPDDAIALAEYLRGIDVHVNLIPYNPIEDAPHLVASDRPTREAFSAAIKAAGFPVTTRYSLGADIAAACGQLIRRRNRALGAAAGID